MTVMYLKFINFYANICTSFVSNIIAHIKTFCQWFTSPYIFQTHLPAFLPDHVAVVIEEMEAGCEDIHGVGAGGLHGQLAEHLPHANTGQTRYLICNSGQ